MILVLLALLVSFLLYIADYYHEDESAYAALESDKVVRVDKTVYGWLFDGPSEDKALVFYPGGKVETTAYAPFLHLLASEGMDVCLVEMPFRLAVFGVNKAAEVLKAHQYVNWYIGGHSLGGAMAANYAAKYGEMLSGIILCAAYPTKALNPNLLEISLYGSEDGILNRKKIMDGYAFAPHHFQEFVIPGGNHAQFGDYGRQRGDGTATISAAEQQKIAVESIIQCIIEQNADKLVPDSGSEK